MLKEISPDDDTNQSFPSSLDEDHPNTQSIYSIRDKRRRGFYTKREELILNYRREYRIVICFRDGVFREYLPPRTAHAHDPSRVRCEKSPRTFRSYFPEVSGQMSNRGHFPSLEASAAYVYRPPQTVKQSTMQVGTRGGNASEGID